MNRFPSIAWLAAGVLLCLGNPDVGRSAAPASEPRILPQSPVPAADSLRSVDEAIREAGLQLKPVLLYFQSENCPVCRFMEKTVLVDPEVKSRLAEYVVLPLNLDVNEAAAARYRVRGSPTFIRLDPTGAEQGRWIGYAAQDEMLGFLALLSTEQPPGGLESPAKPVLIEAAPVLNRFEIRGPDALSEVEWARLMEEMGNERLREQIVAAFKKKKPFPAAHLVRFLEHSALPIRSGALDLLEEMSGENFEYDPWRPLALNSTAIERWKAWAGGGAAQSPAAARPADADAIAGAINDLLSEDIEHELRGRRLLEGAGPEALPLIEGFERSDAVANAGLRNRLREVRYSLILRAARVKNPENLAHRLVHGGLDARTGALEELKPMGAGSFRILEDFLSSPEPLERESAVEICALAGGASAGPRLAQHAKAEQNLNVLHTLLRKLAESGAAEAGPVLADFTKHESEEIVIAALEGIATAALKSHLDSVGACLKDSRWRVRAAALSTLEKLADHHFAAEVIALLDDPDPFVRITAIQLIGKQKLGNVDQRSITLFRDHEELRPALIEMFVRGDREIPREIVAELARITPESLLAIIGGIQDADAFSRPVIEFALAHENRDVEAAALRFLARSDLDDAWKIRALNREIDSGDETKWQVITKALDVSSYLMERENSLTAKPRFGQASLEDEAAPEEQSDAPSGALKNVMEGFFGGADEQTAGSLLELKRRIRRIFAESSTEEAKTAASIILVELGDPKGARFLSSRLDRLQSEEREKLASALSVLRTSAGLPLFRGLLQDPETGVRVRAVSSLFRGISDFDCVRILFEELKREGTRLEAANVETSYLHQSWGDRSQENARRQLLLGIVNGEFAVPLRVLALAALIEDENNGVLAQIERLTKHKDPFIRRAAFDWIGQRAAARFLQHLDEIVNDPSPYVREILPGFAVRTTRYWKTYYSPESYNQDYRSLRSDEQSVRRERFKPEVIERLHQLTRDPSVDVRFAAYLSLIDAREKFDLTEVLSISGDEKRRFSLRQVLDNLFSSYLNEAPPEYAGLLPFYDTSDKRKLAAAKRHFQSETSTGPAKAAANASPSPPPLADADGAGFLVQASAPAAGGLRLIFFSKPGCRDCEEVLRMLKRVKESFPELKVEEWNINKNRSMEANEFLSQQFDVPAGRRLVAPALFGAGGYLIRDDISEERIAELLLKSRGGHLQLPDLAAPEMAQESGGLIAERYHSINPWLIGMAGMLDGINPCAFATIIFLLSYLQVARRRPVEILQIGISYIAGVFGAYFVLGLGLTEVVSRLAVFRQMALVLNLTMGLLTLILAFLSLRDGILCLRNRMGEMALQLPGFLKEGIHGVVRSTARHPLFVLFAFGVGALISVLELACTGQVYAPTVLYMLQRGEGGAAGYLLLYNVAFVLPLAAVFCVSYFGMTSSRLVELLKRNAAWVKFAMAILFLVLSVMLFGRELNT